MEISKAVVHAEESGEDEPDCREVDESADDRQNCLSLRKEADPVGVDFVLCSVPLVADSKGYV